MKLRRIRAILLLIITIIVLFLIIKGIIYLGQRLLGADEVIVIDPGHGGKDPGAIGINNSYEKDIVLDISKKLYERLKSMGYKVVLTRSTDEYVDNELRADMANKKKAKVFISIHCNALENNNTTNGAQVLYYSKERIYSNSQDDEAFAQLVLDEILVNTGAANRGIVEREDLIVLNQTNMPAIIVECGFLTNANEADLLLNKEYQYKIVDALSNALEVYLKDDNNE